MRLAFWTLAAAMSLVAPTSAAASLQPALRADSCHGPVIVIIGDSHCTEDGCSGVTVMVLAGDSCKGRDGGPGETGGTGCAGPAIILESHDSCTGGRGGDGTEGGDGGNGGTGCASVVVNVGNHNCDGAQGGNGGPVQNLPRKLEG